ncbi:MAG: hypothetical protein F4140_02785 [Cenarchaeum sp. SB0675_bin_21]|nr:hypothetical protein [Cenarchaeum sp. SB0675_bin_21]
MVARPGSCNTCLRTFGPYTAAGILRCCIRAVYPWPVRQGATDSVVQASSLKATAARCPVKNPHDIVGAIAAGD